ncbi:MAG: cysteine--1-D-myo-inosityl 2-amino-2-deoxy-alpha-D-glucopyranoside ligase, partial [Dactylosporangium sp.]|nr:cysteine--1-D-myo-inosityl 2-amino-2-deoxy-alpha-D-glucopyranoside ligase [Dactylosporangium sp.]NNJ59509.1 cysteine--1-D-myo-inosityl 2-amino-2-deoxy-alpha-D-glucopyranoside ligase [Dactylosporangium sp.]
MDSWLAPAVPALPGSGGNLALFDSARGRVATTLDDPAGRAARMYVCGITPYDATHLGHAATMITYDVLQRVWRDGGHDVHYVQNVTDIDDPLLERAARDGEDWVRLGLRETALFREDMEALRVLPPGRYLGAVESIPQIAATAAKLLGDGAAYRLSDGSGDIYFAVDAAPRFGYESGLSRPQMLRLAAERGGDPERAGKRDALDPLLWRGARPGEPSWDGGPLGPGRPGWHIECAVIALETLGDTIDVQGGGTDLSFPHHECSAAHAETMTGLAPFARHYVHAGMIGLNGDKMSKSRGNLVLVSRLRADHVDPMAVRLALLADHYRTDRQWTADLLAAAEHRLARWRTAVSARRGPAGAPVLAAVRRCLADDLDTPGALA